MEATASFLASDGDEWFSAATSTFFFFLNFNETRCLQEMLLMESHF